MIYKNVYATEWTSDSLSSLWSELIEHRYLMKMPTPSFIAPQAALLKEIAPNPNGVCWGAVTLWGQCLRNALNSGSSNMSSFVEVLSDSDVFIETCGYYQYVQMYVTAQLKLGPKKFLAETKEFKTDRDELKIFNDRDSLTTTKKNRFNLSLGSSQMSIYDKCNEIQEDPRKAIIKYGIDELNKVSESRIKIKSEVLVNTRKKAMNENKFVESEFERSNGTWELALDIDRLVIEKREDLEDAMDMFFSDLVDRIDDLSDHNVLVCFHTPNHAMGLFVPVAGKWNTKTYPEFYDPNFGIYTRRSGFASTTSRKGRILKLLVFIKSIICKIYLYNTIASEVKYPWNILTTEFWILDSTTGYVKLSKKLTPQIKRLTPSKQFLDPCEIPLEEDTDSLTKSIKYLTPKSRS